MLKNKTFLSGEPSSLIGGGGFGFSAIVLSMRYEVAGPLRFGAELFTKSECRSLLREEAFFEDFDKSVSLT